MRRLLSQFFLIRLVVISFSCTLLSSCGNKNALFLKTEDKSDVKATQPDQIDKQTKQTKKEKVIADGVAKP